MTCHCKKRSKEEATLARAYGYTEREIDKLKAGSVVPLPECGDPQNKDFFSRFRTLEEINNFINNRLCQLRSEIGSHGNSCQVITIGTSGEGRPIYAVEITNPSALKKKEKWVMVIGTLHAREWTSTTSVLLSAIRTDVTDVGVAFIPIVNPDGYEYTWSGQTQIKKKWVKGHLEAEEIPARYWRKNRANNTDGTIGVDLNRNFGSSGAIFGTDKKSKSITLTESDIYQGLSGFSEPETAALQAYHKSKKKVLKAMYDVHCCIGALLEPFSKLKSVPQYVLDTGSVMLKAINMKSPKNEPYAWRPRPVSSASGSGISSSWGFQEARIPFTYVVELRGKFVEKCTLIKPLGNEAWFGLQALLGQVSIMETLINATVMPSIVNEQVDFKTDRKKMVMVPVFFVLMIVWIYFNRSSRSKPSAKHN